MTGGCGVPHSSAGPPRVDVRRSPTAQSVSEPQLPQYFYPMHSGPFTPEDREAMPEDGRRVELIDGALLVSPSAGRAHNDVVMHLFRQLDAACPPDVTIYNVPYDYRLADGSELVPDITVARTADLGDTCAAE